jgi:hypothetical protein
VVAINLWDAISISDAAFCLISPRATNAWKTPSASKALDARLCDVFARGVQRGQPLLYHSRNDTQAILVGTVTTPPFIER